MCISDSEVSCKSVILCFVLVNSLCISFFEMYNRMQITIVFMFADASGFSVRKNRDGLGGVIRANVITDRVLIMIVFSVE